MKTLNTLSDIKAEIEKKEKELKSLKLHLAQENRKQHSKEYLKLVGKCFKNIHGNSKNDPTDYQKILDYNEKTDEFLVLFIDDYKKGTFENCTVYQLKVDFECIDTRKCSEKEFNEVLTNYINHLNALIA